MDLSKLKLDSLGPHEWVTLVMCIVFLVAVICASFLSRKVWMLTMSSLCAVQATFLLIRPEFGISHVSQMIEKNIDIDGVHMHITRLFAVCMLAEAVLYYRFSERDSDPTIFTTMVWSQILSLSLLALNITYSYLSATHSKSKSTAWQVNDVIMWLGLTLLVVELLGGLVQLYRCPSWGGYPETFSRLNLHVRIDYVFVFLCGIVSFALPHWILQLETTIEKLGATHLYLTRAVGVICIGSGLVMGKAPNFLRDNDKVTLLEVRIVQSMIIMLLQVYAQNYYEVFTNYHAILSMGGIVLLTLNSALGYWTAKGYPKFKSN